jgi:hypothetical protein
VRSSRSRKRSRRGGKGKSESRRDRGCNGSSSRGSGLGIGGMHNIISSKSSYNTKTRSMGRELVLGQVLEQQLRRKQSHKRQQQQQRKLSGGLVRIPSGFGSRLVVPVGRELKEQLLKM